MTYHPAMLWPRETGIWKTRGKRGRLTKRQFVDAGATKPIPDAIESKGSDRDFYMTCVDQRHRSKEGRERLLGQAAIPVGEVYLPNDPPRMFQAIQQTRRTRLAFKMLAAGRLSDRSL